MAKKEKYNYLFGPVPSRRLGRSLGVDMVPAKTCSMDCIYCESGGTTNHTLQRKEYFPTQDIIDELDCFLAAEPELDYVTFSGAGEPTLHAGIGKIIRHLKKYFPDYKIALITNAMMLNQPEVFDDVKDVDLIVPSLDAVVQEVFCAINRPVIDVDCQELVEVLARFKRESQALFWLEIFVVPGVNDTPESIELLASAVNKIKPDKVQLNTLDRPGTEKWLKACPWEKMELIAKKFEKFAKVEIISRFKGTADDEKIQEVSPDMQDRIIDMISRRPCTAEDISNSLHCDSKKLRSLILRLVEQGKICSEERERGIFYKIR